MTYSIFFYIKLIIKFFRSKSGKILLLLSLSCWILFTLPIGYLQPYPFSCIKQSNTEFTLEIPHSPTHDSTNQIKNVTQEQSSVTILSSSDVGKSPLTVIDKKNKNMNLVSPLYTSVVYKIQVQIHNNILSQ